MKVLSGRARAELWSLQLAARQVAAERNVAARVLLASRNAATYEAQREFWLEFEWVHLEYCASIRAMAQFCQKHSSAGTKRFSLKAEN